MLTPMSSEQIKSPTQVAGVPQEVAGNLRRAGAGGVTWRDTFAALKHRNFRLFFVGQLVSLTGTWMQSTAQGWLVYPTRLWESCMAALHQRQNQH